MSGGRAAALPPRFPGPDGQLVAAAAVSRHAAGLGCGGVGLHAGGVRDSAAAAARRVGWRGGDDGVAAAARGRARAAGIDCGGGGQESPHQSVF